jgi:hypothetical protein
MLVIRVELHSAITGKVTEIASMRIANTGTGTAQRGNYTGATIRKGSSPLDRRYALVLKYGEVFNYPRASKHVWNLVARMLSTMGYK